MTLTHPTSTLATLSYFVPPPNGEKAYQHISADPLTGERERNYTRADHAVVIENLRGKEDLVATLDTAGFQFFKRPAKYTTFDNGDEEIVKEYYPESIELIKELTGASRVVLFDHSTSFPFLQSKLTPTPNTSHPPPTPRRIRRLPLQTPTRVPSPRRPNDRSLNRPRAPTPPRFRRPRPPQTPLPDHKPLATHLTRRLGLASGSVRLSERRSGEGRGACDVGVPG